MNNQTRILGHPVHQVLVVIPLGLLATSFFFDLAWLLLGRAELAIAAAWMIFAGVLGGIAAASFGLADWRSIPRGTRAWRMGAWHGGGNAIVTILFAASWLLRKDIPDEPEGAAIALSALGVALTVLTGWLGGELADRLAEAGGPEPARPVD